MIDVKDLRQGNLIHRVYTYKDQPDRNHTDIEVVREATEYWLTNSCGSPEPIVLTPEILEKCGFEHNMDGWYLEGEINQKSFRSDDNRHGWGMTYSDIDEKDIHFRFGYSSILITDAPARHIKYLHEVQNLYYWLTKQELTVNLNDEQ